MPDFSNRDPFYDDLAAPGAGDLLDLPARSTVDATGSASTRATPTAGRDEFRRGEGTSFAAPQVSAAAALLLARAPRR